MTSSYLVLTADGATDVRHDKTRFIRDRFSFLAFLFPWIWLAVHRLWLLAAAAFALQILSRVLMTQSGLWPAGVAVGFATMLVTGLEGRNWYMRDLLRKGWKEDAIITGPSLQTAEDIYFSSLRQPEQVEAAPVHSWQSRGGAAQGGATSLDLFGFNGGR